MMNIDNMLEEVIGNKLELVGPVLDSYLCEIEKHLIRNFQELKLQALSLQYCCFFPGRFFVICLPCAADTLVM